MEYKQAILVVTAHALCCLDDGQGSCDMCPAHADNEIECDKEYWTKEKLRDAVNTIMAFEE